MKPTLPASLLLAIVCSATAQPQGGPPPGEHRGPPPEALAACKAAKAGADCSFSHEGRMVKGSCWAPDARPLACRPANPGDRPTPPAPPRASAPKR